MIETQAEGLKTVWLDGQQIQALGSRMLPLAIMHGEPSTQQVMETEAVGESLWPTDFSDDTADIFTNTLCHGAGEEGNDRLCTYCFFNTAQLKDATMMSLESLDMILDWAKSDWTDSEPGKIRTVSLLGGEFALHPDAKEIIKQVWAAGFNIRIVTNGSKQFQALLMDDEVAGMLRDGTRDNLIAVSLDSMVESDNDKNRGTGATKMALETIEILNQTGREIPFRINATPLLNCIDGLPDLYRRAEELNARRLLVHYPDAVGRGRSLVPGPQSHKLSQQPDRNDWQKVRAGADAYSQDCADRQSNFRVRCEQGFGEVLNCHMVERSSSLHFSMQINDEGGSYIPVAACAFSMESTNADSAYILRDGLLRERKGASQLATAHALLGKTASCPLYPGRACIYES